MRIAVQAASEVAARAARMLLAEPDLVDLGLVDRAPSGRDRRVRRVSRLEGYDVVLSDDREAPEALTERAARAGASCVLWSDRAVAWDSPQTLLVGANLGTGIAPALAAHEAAATGSEQPVTLAWTEPGRPLRQGVPVAFPDPVGSLWAEERPSSDGATLLAAPQQSDWAGALVIVGDRERPSRIVGVADDARHLEAIALAAGAVTTARGRYPGGPVTPDAAAEDYLLAALAMGLEVAGFNPE